MTKKPRYVHDPRRAFLEWIAAWYDDPNAPEATLRHIDQDGKVEIETEIDPALLTPSATTGNITPTAT